MDQNAPLGLGLEILFMGFGSKVGQNAPFYTTFIKNFLSKCDQIHTFIEEILDGELHFFCSDTLNYLIKYMIKILPGVTTDMTCQSGTDLVLS